MTVPNCSDGYPTVQEQQACGLVQHLQHLLHELGLDKKMLDDCMQLAAGHHPRKLHLWLWGWLNKSRRIKWAILCDENILHGKLAPLRDAVCTMHGEHLSNVQLC